MESGAWHAREADTVFRELGSSAYGLSSDDATKRLSEYGANVLAESGRQTAWGMFLDQFKNLLVVILIIAAVVSAALGFAEGKAEDIYEAAAILVVVVFITVVGFFQEYRAEKEILALKRMVSVEATVLRGGKYARIPARELVPGDVIILEAGDRIPADSRLFSEIEFKVDESALTGESLPVSKDVSVLGADIGIGDRRNMVYMGTHAAYGKASALVVNTGMRTELGKIAETISSMENERTPLQEKLDAVGKQIGLIVLVLCVIIFAAGLAREGSLTKDAVIYMFMVAIALAVAAVPEGLPAVVTVALAKGMRDMVKKKALVKKLSAVETLGSTTVICSDKTGTLTRNEMTVRRIYLGEKTIDVSGQGYSPEGEFTCSGKPLSCDISDLQLLLRITSLSNNASLEKDVGGWKITGDPTEAALLVVASKAGIWRGLAEKHYPRLAEIPFSSERKRMSTIHKTSPPSKAVYTKGAPDVILGLCSMILVNGKERPMTDADRKNILSANEAYAKTALRVLGAAYRNLSDHEKYNSDVERDLVFAGLLGMIDPPRDDATEAVAIARHAGIKTVIITGDHMLTAQAIAGEMGIFSPGDKTITGGELEKLSDDQFLRIVDDVVIYARVSPEHKVRIVSALKAKGHIVAMTGDGVNDAPALKKADIGVAMGITGTDVAKEAGDMILVDDNFASIVSAIKEGRGIYANIRLFIKYLLSCNISEVLTIFLAMAALSRLPLEPLQILWMNLLTDTAPAIALAWNPADPDVMEHKPRNPRENIINRSNLFKFFGVGLLIAAGTFFLFYYSAPEKAMTMAFSCIIVSQMFYALSCRSEKSFFSVGLFSNRYLLIAILVSLSMQVLVIYLPLFQSIFKTTPLDLIDWIKILAVSSTAFILPELWKIMCRK
ncbi:MAG: calcium-translocating P-type ATPase, SERCA-type [Candidatus Altiarchaeia archaeon]